MEATINTLELASELAESHMIQRLSEMRGCSEKKFLELYYDEIYVEGEGCISYTEDAQDVFNDYYDFYLDFIERVAKR